jgi:hypothetical protein
MSPGYGTASVVIATAPTALSTVISHIVSWPHRRKHRNQQQQQEQPSEDGTATPALMAQSANSSDTLPPQQLRYEEGLKIVRNFLDFASRHTLEGVQDFTAQPVPVPRESE